MKRMEVFSMAAVAALAFCSCGPDGLDETGGDPDPSQLEEPTTEEVGQAQTISRGPIYRKWKSNRVGPCAASYLRQVSTSAVAPQEHIVSEYALSPRGDEYWHSVRACQVARKTVTRTEECINSVYYFVERLTSPVHRVKEVVYNCGLQNLCVPWAPTYSPFTSGGTCG